MGGVAFMVQEKYGVRLAAHEKGRLRQTIRSGRSSAQAITRARILLKTDEGWTASQVAQPRRGCSGTEHDGLKAGAQCGQSHHQLGDRRPECQS